MDKSTFSGFLLTYAFCIVMLAGCGGDGPLAPVDETPDATGPKAFERNQRLGRGINLGNALEAPTEGDWGVVLQQEYFELIRQAGFNSVRIPIKWSAHAETSQPYRLRALFLSRVEWSVQQALQRGLAAVINVHHYDEMMQDPAAQKARFLGIWAQIAEHFRDYSADLYFELLNEPNTNLTPSLWNGYLDEAIEVIRSSNPDRILVVGPGNWNSLLGLASLQLPEEDRGLIVSFHYYDPFNFTHQGADWVPGSDGWLGTRWQGTAGEQALVRQDLNAAAAWAKAVDRPLYIGEFGAYSAADMASRAAWTGFVARVAEDLDISWAYWEFGAGFGAYDREAAAWRPGLLNALVPAAPGMGLTAR